MEGCEIKHKLERDKLNTKNLTNKTIKGIFWVLSGKVSQVIVKLIVFVILARLLVPEDFGIVGSALIVISFSEIFSKIGMGPALVQRPCLTEKHIRTAFTFSVFLGLLIFFIVFSFSPLISNFFNIEELTKVTRIMSIIFVIDGISIVSEALIERQLKFKLFAKIQIISYIIGFGIVGIILAVLNYGIWALVMAHISQALVKTILAVTLMPHNKKICFHYKSFKELIYYTGGHTIAHIANNIALQGDKLIIGRYLGAESLGLYERSYQLMVMPASTMGMVLDKTLFPIMSKVQDDIERLSNAYKKIVGLIALVVLPISVYMILMSNEIVLLFLGLNWIDIVPVFKILALGMLFRISYKISSSLSRALGAVYKRATRQIVYAIVVVVGSLIGYKWGIVGVAFAVLIALFTNFILMAHLCLKLTNLSWNSFIRAHLNGILFSLFLGVLIKVSSELLKMFTNVPIILLLVTGIIFLLVNILVFNLKIKFFIGEDGIWLRNTIFKKLN